jgi:dihydropyrimidine dehydrogenase (NAD+) subunit PreA
MAISWVREATSLPVIVKLTPNVTDITSLAQVAKDAGANAVTATNTLSGLAGIDLESFAPLPTVDQVGIFGGYSGPGLKPVSLRCAASINKTVDIPVIGCGGIGSWKDAAEYFAVGASLVEVCTSVMWNGYGIIDKLKSGIEKYLDEHGYPSLEDIRGRALSQIVNFPQLNLEVRLVAQVDEQECTGCGICVKACQSGGYNAMTMKDRKVDVDFFKCDGCGLCVGVCPYGIVKMVLEE